MTERLGRLLATIRNPVLDLPMKFETIASALEELDERTRVLTGVAPRVFANCCPSCGVTDFRNMTCPKCGRTCSTGHVGIPVSPPPSREGEASSWKTTAQSIGCMVLHVFGDGTETGALLDQHELDGKCNALLIKAGAELEAARARVGELTTAIRHELSRCDNAPPCDMCDSLRAALDEPTPAAPTPAVVEKPNVPIELKRRTPGEMRAYADGIEAAQKVHPAHAMLAAQSVRESAAAAEKESPPRDSGGELVLRRRSPDGMRGFADGLRQATLHGLTREAAELNAKRLYEEAKNVERKGTGETAEAEAPEVVPVADADRQSVPGREGRDGGDRRVAPPGLTPEEAEEWAIAKWYELHFSNFAVELWEDLDDDEQADVTRAYRFAHSEGAKAAKAEGVLAARVAKDKAIRLVACLSDRLGNESEWTRLARLLEAELEALAAELEKR